MIYHTQKSVSTHRCVLRLDGRHKMKVDNAMEDTEEAGKVAGGVTSEWLKQAEDASLKTSPARTPGGSQRDPSFSVIEEFNYWRMQPDLAAAVAAIKALTAVIKHSQASTMMGLEIELKNASEALKAWDETSIPLSAGCDLFLRYVTRTSALEYEDIRSGKARLIERGERFSEISQKARRTIAMLGQDFILNGSAILTHGFSRVVLSLLKLAAANGKHFSVICTEGRPDNTGPKVAKELLAFGIPVTLILDSAVGYVMEKVDMLLIGAEGVVESGGIINYLGTFQAALVARSMNKPVYVAAESYKFSRLYPLEQRDVGPSPGYIDFLDVVPDDAVVENAVRDYTPPNYLTLLFTDLGVLTPSAVSDELIQLYL